MFKTMSDTTTTSSTSASTSASTSTTTSSEAVLSVKDITKKTLWNHVKYAIFQLPFLENVSAYHLPKDGLIVKIRLRVPMQILPEWFPVKVGKKGFPPSDVFEHNVLFPILQEHLGKWFSELKFKHIFLMPKSNKGKNNVYRDVDILMEIFSFKYKIPDFDWDKFGYKSEERT